MFKFNKNYHWIWLITQQHQWWGQLLYITGYENDSPLQRRRGEMLKYTISNLFIYMYTNICNNNSPGSDSQLIFIKLEAQEDQKSLTWIRLVMICSIVPRWPHGYQLRLPLAIFESACCLDWNKMVLAILNLHNTPMPPIKCQLNSTYCLGNVVWTISRWLTWRPSWISERNNFSKTESECRPNASHQFSAQSDIVREQIWFEDYQDDR